VTVLDILCILRILRNWSWDDPVQGDGSWSRSRGFGDGGPQRVVEGRRHRSWVWGGLLVMWKLEGERRIFGGEEGRSGAVVFDVQFLCAQRYLLSNEKHACC
jgi:hypothetical protein